MALLRALADLLFPPVCKVCKKGGDLVLCDGCRSQFRLIGPPVCVKCGHPLRGPPELRVPCPLCRHRTFQFAQARATGVYEAALRTAIHAMKFRGARGLARPFGWLMAQTAEQWGVGVDVIVPVPLHPVRLRERGYNQSELLAREVAETVGVPVRAGVLRRCRATEAQSSLGLADRGPNVQSAFIAVEAVDGSRVMLIDDVFSSGHTASACAGALLLGGARRVYVLTAAMAVLDFGPGAMEV